ncbi:hypothetical protein [Streptomyces luteireticuli]|uniref:Uncharacterized protein n=1 Tax=Streptomyces luteireticuli TaxID=173858 RepID=A0ABP3IL90_9ACTN
MPRPSLWFSWRSTDLTALLASGLLVPTSAHTAVGIPETGTYMAQLAIGDEANARGCSAT